MSSDSGGKLLVVVGGQFGSEAKGHVAHRLVEREIQSRPVVGVRVAGPNAGHTAHDWKGRPWALRTIPVMAVVDPTVQLVIAAGSEIDLPVLEDEVARLEAAGIPIRDRLFIDRQATILDQNHYSDEAEAELTERIGSTGKGVGAARADRIMRTARIIGDLSTFPTQYHVIDTAQYLELKLGQGYSVIVEGTQGYGLGLHAGYYPFCTSSDCRVVDFLAMAGISPWSECVSAFEVWVVLRTYPIRVAGNSGPLFDEQDWGTLGEYSGGHIKPEFTTVTKKMRRVGGWDSDLARAAIRANGGPGGATRVALTFLDYIDPAVANDCSSELSSEAWEFIAQVEQEIDNPVSLVTTGPNTAVWL